MPSSRTILVLVLVLWAGAIFMGFYRFSVLEPDDFGFTAGMNKLEAFLRWQLVAMALALPAWVLGRRAPPGLLRRLSWVPVAWLLLLVCAVLALIAWSWLQHMLHPPQTEVPGPATVPVAPSTGVAD
jgi:type VI protein secretion system component VasF